MNLRSRLVPLTRPGPLEILLYIGAASSLTYAIVTAHERSIDLHLFYNEALALTSRDYTVHATLYPPYARILFLPLAAFSFDWLVYGWLVLQLGMMVGIFYLAIKLWGENWSARAVLFFCSYVCMWAPVRVELRNGQIASLILLILLGALLAASRDPIFAGVLLGIALCKYSLTYPFFLYSLWKRNWKTVAAALSIPLILSAVFLLMTGISPIAATAEYLKSTRDVYSTAVVSGSTEIKLLLMSFTANNQTAASVISVVLAIIGLAAIVMVIRRSKENEPEHLAVLALFALWTVYHRIYDVVLCIVPAAIMIRFYLRGTHRRFAIFWLCALAVLVADPPGVLADRFGFSVEALNSSLAGWLGLNIERIVVFTMFWSMIVLLWKDTRAAPKLAKVRSETAEPIGGTHSTL